MSIEADIEELVGNPHAIRRKPQGPTINTDELADLLDLSVNRVLALARSGQIPRLSKGRFDRRDAVRAYCSYVRKNPVGRGSADSDYTAAKTRAAEATAEKLENANAITRRDLIPAIEVEREWSAILRDVRAALLALPTRLQQRLGHLTTRDITAIDREIRSVLEEIANDDS